MPETKTMIRFFTIADYEEEEIWLHEQHKNRLEAAQNDPTVPLYF